MVEASQVEDYLLHLVARHIAGEQVAALDMCSGLALRLQSCTNLPTGNLLADLWKDGQPTLLLFATLCETPSSTLLLFAILCDKGAATTKEAYPQTTRIVERQLNLGGPGRDFRPIRRQYKLLKANVCLTQKMHFGALRRSGAGVGRGLGGRSIGLFYF